MIAAISVLALAQPGSADELAGTQYVTYHDEPFAIHRPPELSQATHDLLAKTAEIVDFNASDFSGMYLQDDNKHVTIVPTSDRGQEIAERLLADDEMAVITRGTISLDAATEYGSQLYERAPDSLRRKIWEWGAEPTSDAVHLGLRDELLGNERDYIEGFAQANAIHLDVYIQQGAPVFTQDDARLEDDSPVAGGSRFIRATTQYNSALTAAEPCSAGFGFKSDSGVNYILTAGHCFDQGTNTPYMWSSYATSSVDDDPSKKQWMGHRAVTSYDNGTGTVRVGRDNGLHGDVALVNVDDANRNSSDHVWWDGPFSANKVPVTERRIPTLNDDICINGFYSGADCGLFVSKLNTTVTFADGDVVKNVDTGYSTNSSDCSHGGDSGGSIVYDHPGAETHITAIGIVSGHGSAPGGCGQIFTGVEEAMQAWGGSLKFAS